MRLRRVGRTALVWIVMVGVVTWLATIGITSEVHAQAAAEEGLVAEMNRARGEAGLAPLTVDVQLGGVGRVWAERMAIEDRLAHNPDYAAQITGDWQRVGENVGFAQDAGAQVSGLVTTLHTSFMNSQGHKDNILGDYDHVGVGAVLTGAGKLWVTVNFARFGTEQVAPRGTID